MDQEIGEAEKSPLTNRTKSDGVDAASERIPQPSFACGSLVADRYKILSVVASGGSGTVYQVEQVFLGRQFAMKTLNASLISDVALLRFQAEARSTNRLHHENIVKTIDFGMIEQNQPFLVMDLVEGIDLAAYLKEKGTLSLAASLELLLPICSALAYAHREGVVHRDIKPANILLARDHDNSAKFVPKLADFGIAKIALSQDGEALTKTGEVFGTPVYMSPEQCSGIKVDNRSDIYALGCVLYECLTGAPPFRGGTAVETITQHLSAIPLSLKEASMGREFPRALEEIVTKTLEKDPQKRYQACADLASDLRKVGKGRDFNGSKGSSVTRAKPGSTKKVQLIFTLTGFAVLFSAIALNYFGVTKHAAHDRGSSDLSHPTASEDLHASSSKTDRQDPSPPVGTQSSPTDQAAASDDQKLSHGDSDAGKQSMNLAMATTASSTADSIHGAGEQDRTGNSISTPSINDSLHDSTVYEDQKRISWIEGIGDQKKRYFDFGKDIYGRFDWILANGSVMPSVPARGKYTIPGTARVRFDISQRLICFQPNLLAKLKDAEPIRLTLKIDDGASLLGEVDGSAYDNALVFADHLTSLEELYMSATPVTSEGLTDKLHIDRFPKLISLTIEKTFVDGKTLDRLPARFWGQLMYLNINHVQNGKSILNLLKNSKRISILYLAHLNLDDKDMESLSKIPSLHGLHLKDNVGITNRGFQQLLKLPQLESINIEGCSIDSRTLPILKTMKQLHDIALPKKFWSPRDVNELRHSLPTCIVKVK